ncbi:MAG: cysteine hydrolase [Oscillospiraceae bacterium]|nr:cysteine hydrolase [Oscillospiraceae bacterium]
MKRFLIVVDMQKDFVDGALGTSEAQQIVPAVVEKIRTFDGEIIVTYDTHEQNYMTTREGRFLPVPHCIRDTEGWQLNTEVAAALAERAYTVVEKPTFGAVTLPEVVQQLAGEEEFTVELIGLCTDICVVSNALLLKAAFPETDMTVDAACCAGVTPESHQAALTTMSFCQIVIENN